MNALPCAGLLFALIMETAGTHSVERLRSIMAQLRSPEGCPWDQKQTLKTLKPYLLEEAYEVLEAIDSGDAEAHCEELGDLLLQIVFQSQLCSEEGSFNLDDVAHVISEKLVRRHPHVFGDVDVADADEVLKNWDEIKRQEKGGADSKQSVLAGVPHSLPALAAAQEIQKRAARAGFDWSDVEGPLDKIEEEVHELREAIALKDHAATEEELGDLLFSVVNLARHFKVHAELALQGTNTKFRSRFTEVEKRADEQGLDMAKLELETLDALWDEAKNMERGQ